MFILERVDPERLEVVPHLDDSVHPPRVDQIYNIDERAFELLLAFVDGVARRYADLTAQVLVSRELLFMRELPVWVVGGLRLGEVVQLDFVPHRNGALAGVLLRAGDPVL